MSTKLRPNEPLAPRHPLPRTPQLDRDAHLLELCRGKRVLHLACAAWPATEMWCRDQSLLHLRLGKVTAQLAGFDWSQPGLDVLQQYGVTDLHRVNLLVAEQVREAWQKLPWQPEVVLAGELLEHIDRPGLLLENCRPLLGPETRLVITVPNAFSVRSMLHVLCGHEKVAPDHVAYYSPSTARELVQRNGLQITDTHWYRYSPARKPIDRLVDTALAPAIWFWPQLSEGLIAECCLDADWNEAGDAP